MAKDLRYFLNKLQKEAPEELMVVEREVDCNLELTAVLRKLQGEKKAPAVLFKHVKGCAMPVIANVLGNRKKLAMTLESSEEAMLKDYIAREDARIKPVLVEEGPVQEVVLTGDDIDLAKIPVVVNCEKDSGAFITIGITVVKDPETGTRNSGVYRMMVLGKDTLGMSYEKHTHIGHIHRKMIAQNKPLEVVTFIGHHPCCMIGSQSKVPLGVDEWEVMGGLLQEPLEIVKCKTVDLEVPAWAEMAIEGVIYPDEVAPEGPFGEYTWYYGLERRSPVMHVTAITHRKDVIYQHLFAAHPEHNYTGQLGRESVLYKRVSAIVPSVKAVHMPIHGTCRFTAFVQIAKEYDGEGKLAALGALASDSFMKMVVVVDQDINIFDDSEVLWAIATRTQPDRAIFFVPEAAGSRLDPASYSIWNRVEKDSLTTKIAIDATMPIESPFEERADVPRPLWENLDLAAYIKDYQG